MPHSHKNDPQTQKSKDSNTQTSSLKLKYEYWGLEARNPKCLVLIPLRRVLGFVVLTVALRPKRECVVLGILRCLPLPSSWFLLPKNFAESANDTAGHFRPWINVGHPETILHIGTLLEWYNSLLWSYICEQESTNPTTGDTSATVQTAPRTSIVARPQVLMAWGGILRQMPLLRMPDESSVMMQHLLVHISGAMVVFILKGDLY